MTSPRVRAYIWNVTLLRMMTATTLDHAAERGGYSRAAHMACARYTTGMPTSPDADHQG